MAYCRDASFDVQRIYAEKNVPGYRVLIDRLWPRGIKKAGAALDEWLKDAAPSSELRRWYGHDPARFEEFACRYGAELIRPPASDAVARLRRLGRHERVILLTATRDVEHSGAQVLRDHLTSATG
jgi:uncharacterized protein YeaO (DUF488 family)